MRATAAIPGVVARLLFLCLLALAPAAPGAARAAEGPAKPAMTVVVQRDVLLAKQWVGVRAWVANETDAPLAKLQLSLEAPAYLQLGTVTGTSCVVGADATISLDSPLAPHSTGVSPPLCVQARENISEEDTNVAFVLAYVSTATPPAPADAKPPAKSAPPPKAIPTKGVVIVEKTLKLGLLGTESVAGVSLRLVGYFLPGALLLMVLSLFKFPGTEGLDGGDRAIVAVIVSLLLGWLVSQFGGGVTGSSFRFLAIVSGLALAIAFLLVIGHWTWTKAQEKAQQALVVDYNDDDKTILAKALLGKKDKAVPTTIETREGRFVGSCSAPTTNRGYVLMGWFAITPGDPADAPKLKALLDQGEYAEAFRLAAPRAVRTIRTRTDTGLIGGDKERLWFQAKDHPRVVEGPVDGLGIPDGPVRVG